MGRRDFCLFWLAGLILRIGIGYLAQHTEVSPTLFGLAVIALFIPPIVRRLHDLGYSGWLSIGVIAIPYVSVFLLFFAGENGPNVYGPPPKQKKDVVPGAAPNGGPATPVDNSEVTKGPPSVS